MGRSAAGTQIPRVPSCAARVRCCVSPTARFGPSANGEGGGAPGQDRCCATFHPQHHLPARVGISGHPSAATRLLEWEGTSPARSETPPLILAGADEWHACKGRRDRNKKEPECPESSSEDGGYVDPWRGGSGGNTFRFNHEDIMLFLSGRRRKPRINLSFRGMLDRRVQFLSTSFADRSSFSRGCLVRKLGPRSVVSEN